MHHWIMVTFQVINIFFPLPLGIIIFFTTLDFDVVPLILFIYSCSFTHHDTSLESTIFVPLFIGAFYNFGPFVLLLLVLGTLWYLFVAPWPSPSSIALVFLLLDIFPNFTLLFKLVFPFFYFVQVWKSQRFFQVSIPFCRQVFIFSNFINFNFQGVCL